MNNFETTFSHFIKALKVPVTQDSALEFLQAHPNEGSLLAYAESLDHFKIENAGIKIEHERFNELPTPFVVYLHQYGGTFALVKEVNNDRVSWLDTEKGWLNTTKEDFLELWRGIALLAEPNAESGEKDFAQKRKIETLGRIRIPLAIALLVLVIGVFSFSVLTAIPAPIFPVLFLIKVLGITVSSLLLVKSLDSKNDLVNKLCNNGPKVNCQSILDSPAAHITSWLSWSDLGFIYFFGSFMSLIVCSYSGSLNTYITVQWAFSLVSIFFSAYSLWYQGIKSKMWCTLCLIVVSVFVLELVSLIGLSAIYTQIEGIGLSYILAGFLVPIIFLLLYKHPFVKALEQKVLKIKLNKIYSNPAYFEAIMQNQPQMPDIPEDMPTIFFGNPNAENIITIVSNPLCSPCARMHKYLEELTEENANVKCQVLFLSAEHNAGGQFIRKLFSLPIEQQEMAISEWYTRNDMNFEKWNENYEAYTEHPEAKRYQIEHNEWTNTAEIKATPTLFINGKRKPENVSVKELGQMLTLYKGALID